MSYSSTDPLKAFLVHSREKKQTGIYVLYSQGNSKLYGACDEQKTIYKTFNTLYDGILNDFLKEDIKII